MNVGWFSARAQTDGWIRAGESARAGWDEVVVGMRACEEEGVRRQTGEWESTTATHTWEWIGMRWNGFAKAKKKNVEQKETNNLFVSPNF